MRRMSQLPITFSPFSPGIAYCFTTFGEQLDLKTALCLYSNLSVEALQQLSYLLTSSAMSSFNMTAVWVLQRGQVGGLTEAIVTAQRPSADTSIT
jgi:hypothetical protein